MHTADAEEQRGYFYSCISDHLQVVITRNTPAGASIFREEGQEYKACFSTRRYELFMMRQPKGKTMYYYTNTQLEAADIADIYQLTPMATA